MKNEIHLRQFSFTPHSWSDLYEAGITTQKLAPEIEGLRKNVLKFELASPHQHLYLHHWMVCDESQLTDKIKIEIVSPLPTPTDIDCRFKLLSLIVANQEVAQFYKETGLPILVQEANSKGLSWKMRKRDDIWALQLEPLASNPFIAPEHLGSSFKIEKELHSLAYQSESHCLDLVISNLITI